MTGLKSILAAATAFLLIGATNTASAADETSSSRVRVSLAETTTADKADRSDDGSADRKGGEVAQGGSGGAAATAGSTSTTTSTTADGESDTAAESAAVVNSDANRGGGGSAATGDSAAGSAPIFLSTGDDTCMGASGVGVQTFEFGFSVGSSWTEEACVTLKNARELSNQGHPKAAKARLCMNEDNALAFEMTGEPCPRALPSTQAALDEIRQWNPGYGVAANPDTQVASAAPVSRARSESVATRDESAEGGSRWGTLVAMVTSLLDGADAGHGPAGPDSVTAMDGVE
ncbi:MAG: hypothetical protein AAF942_05065 [Pseudomonadota bacterium]